MRDKVLCLCGMVAVGMQLPDVSIKVLIGQGSERKEPFFSSQAFLSRNRRKDVLYSCGYMIAHEKSP